MEKQPDLYALEHSGGDNPESKNKTKLSHSERRLHSFVGNPEMDSNDRLKMAREAILDDERLYEKFFRAIKERSGRDSTGFASIENVFIKYCLDLSESDIEAFVRQFNKGLSTYAEKHSGTLDREQKDPEEIQRREIKFEGIMSVINYIKARRLLLDQEPASRYDFVFDDVLDAKYKIDLIEQIYSEEDGHLNITTMNLVQVKSSEPMDEEKRKILESHMAWIHSSLMDFDSFEKEYTDGMPDEVAIETLGRNAEEVKSILEDICTDPSGFNADKFIKKLNLEFLKNKHKAWLLLKWSKVIKNYVLRCVEENIATQEQADSIIRTIDEMESKLVAKAKLPRNIAHIHNINSVITVGPQIIQTEVIATQPATQGKNKILKYTQ